MIRPVGSACVKPRAQAAHFRGAGYGLQTEFQTLDYERGLYLSELFDFTLPYLIQGKTKGLLSIFDERFLGSPHHFVRFDLYPLTSPSHLQRHYGWWDIPLKKIRKTSTEIWFDWSSRRLRLAGWGKSFRQTWKGPLDEEGYCHLHVSLWDGSSSPPQLLALKSSPLVIATRGLDLPLKQVCIPVTDRCNLKCTMCPRQGTDEIIDMDITDEALEPLLEAGPNFVSAFLKGQGEPLLYPKIFNLIPRLKGHMAPGGEVGLTTNATLLDESTTVRLLDTGLDFLYFSLDAASQEVYEAIRVGASFDRVTENIRRCIRYRQASGRTRPRFMLNFVMLEQNLHEIPALVALAADLGVEHVTFSYCTDNTTGTLKAFGAEVLQRLFRQAHEAGETLHVKVNTPPLPRDFREICFYMERAVVLLPGRVFPCYHMAPGYKTQTRSRSFGDVHRTSLLDIWNRPDYREFRRRVLTGDFPPECQGCEFKFRSFPQIASSREDFSRERNF
jgi:MoaA/NifB/PqqE/SkfB family radical SAM enzyme